MVTIKKPDTINGIKLKHGRTVCVHVEDYECLYEHCKGYKDYIEIGTMHGASAIVAGYGVTGEVHGIDPFGVRGQAARKDKFGFYVKPEYVKENWEMHHEPDRLILHKQKHPPWPKVLGKRMFDIGLIDGRHYIDQVKQDWKSMSKYVKHKILFHDVRSNPDNGKNPNRVFHEIIKLPEWKLLEVRGCMGVVERVI
jgi:hypothetical protein